MRSTVVAACLLVLFIISESPVIAGMKSNEAFALGLSSGSHLKTFLSNLPDSDSDSNRQIPVQKTPEINYGRLAIIGGLFTGAITAIHVYQQNGWWKDNRAPFHFQEDLVYGLSVDKMGHFYGATLLTFVFKNALESANLPEKQSLYYGAAGALLFQTYVEIEDGFSKWGFDRVDFASDLGGSIWPIVQYEYPVFDNFDLKFSYIPSPLVNNPGSPAFKGQKHTMIDDYEGQTLWLSTKVHNLIPESAAKYWPSFLCLAVGYGAKNIDAVKPPWPYSVVYVAIDYDFTKIIPDSTPFLKGLGKALNFIHFPAPAVRISPSTIWYGLFF